MGNTSPISRSFLILQLFFLIFFLLSPNIVSKNQFLCGTIERQQTKTKYLRFSYLICKIIEINLNTMRRFVDSFDDTMNLKCISSKMLPSNISINFYWLLFRTTNKKTMRWRLILFLFFSMLWWFVSKCDNVEQRHFIVATLTLHFHMSFDPNRNNPTQTKYPYMYVDDENQQVTCNLFQFKR